MKRIGCFLPVGAVLSSVLAIASLPLNSAPGLSQTADNSTVEPVVEPAAEPLVIEQRGPTPVLQPRSPQTGAAPTAAPASAPQVDENYLLGTDDFLQITVFNAPDYSGEFRVLSGGVLNLPIVGSVPVDGLTLAQASDVIETYLSEYVRRPRVTLSVLETRPFQIAIAGEVHRPGAYKVSIEDEESRSGLPTLTQMIETAGGITQSADIRNIQVIRRQPPDSTALAQGQTTPTDAQLTIDLWTLLTEGNLEEDLVLQDGDRVIIPEASDLSPSEISQLASANFSPDTITVNVVGEVERPGAIQVEPDTPLNQAVLAAGGFNTRAERQTVKLVRLNPNGTVTEQDIEVDFAQGIDSATNPTLRPNDTVIVGRSDLASLNDSLGILFSPFTSVLGVLRLLGL